MTGRPLEIVVAALESHGCKPRSGSARCPAHKDRSPSLSFAEGSDGRALLTCHRGCSLDEIVAAVQKRGGQMELTAVRLRGK